MRANTRLRKDAVRLCGFFRDVFYSFAPTPEAHSWGVTLTWQYIGAFIMCGTEYIKAREVVGGM